MAEMFISYAETDLVRLRQVFEASCSETRRAQLDHEILANGQRDRRIEAPTRAAASG